MKYSSIHAAQSVVAHCKAKGVQNIVISPGSRNAPLTIGFTEDSYFKCFSIVDERCAAFFALGIAQQLREPVAVVCTSGSALLNYYPAVTEAFYSDIPLVVISADRPSYKIDVGDGQTIRQDDVFHRHIGYSANLKQDVNHALDRIERYAPELLKNTQKDIQGYNDAELNKALETAITTGLPVHINVRFEEPLYNRLAEPSVSPEIKDIKEPEARGLEHIPNCAEIWNASVKKLVLVGVNDPNKIEQEFLDLLGNDPSVIVLTETTSNLHHSNFFPSVDSIIAPIEKSEEKEKLFLELQPDVLLTFGGLIVSKKIKAFLREYKPAHHWHIDPVKAYDTFFSLSIHFKMNVNTFFGRFKNILQNTSSSAYFRNWNSVRQRYELKRKEYVEQIGFSDMLAFHRISESVPENYQLQLANSSTIRYAQLFDLNPSLQVFCNRGTSGIDGSTSTAIGASIYKDIPTLFITGDLSFLYDSNGLWNEYIRADFRIIVINNDGGGIFRILPGKENTAKFERFFETKHNLNVRKYCELFNFEYFFADSENGLNFATSAFYEPSERPRLLEVSTPRILNDKILLGYFDFIS
ncbi:2-succinyl-5-enolpyruvyl-6-hydroxy-3-cyclohexene-1-carboxylic-acid synthase [Maribacter algarum]|uniref:2-succinyl-5-enolpyruvyl-6-hydroxy-3-cyclohexene-1-carboxylate synthase n=1 Tax=Maribacter algarum (ex Zhang et al. 2020) TaxID=2578118 RepID=A0A5S3PQF2_9FLAO|nr:2-succinyl-5-enolpyruvyl-6-hydroxy-3-cyclohexene-1-carboxylic-acid synthase [Maribacter algarum]TMM56980.1 2-succinyl-5-enolpyruvyl-6-hydroxy-3-cyclohexene-1-carboxylic-acid synthase [Maribacter algarum]